MARYFLTKEKLRKYLILITLKGHQWDLRSSDHNFVGVVKVNFVECRKEFGSTMGSFQEPNPQPLRHIF